MAIWDMLTGESAAKAAYEGALATQAAGKKAQQQYGQAAVQFQPYQTAGTSALDRWMAGMGLGGDQQAFTNAYRNLPGYQSGLETGTTAALRAANAGPGSLGGTRALQNLYRFGSNYENERIGDYFNRLTGGINTGMGATGQATGLLGQGIGANYGAETQAVQGGIAAEQAKQNALTNLLAMGAQLAGTAMGGPVGGQLGGKLFSGMSGNFLGGNNWLRGAG